MEDEAIRYLDASLARMLREEIVTAYVEDDHLVVETECLTLDCDLRDDLVAFGGAAEVHCVYGIVDAFRALRMWYLDWLTPPGGYD